jgi:protein-S-isoprenylcysteine O-methyltransferase Ste14
MNWNKKNIFWMAVLYIPGVICFPANPLVLTGVLETSSYPALFIIGWVVWAFGMALVLSPVIMFPRHGGVPKRESFVNTTRLVDTGIYAVVRHPLYLGGILSIFVTTLLWYPHWLFGMLGAVGTAIICLRIVEEEQHLVQQFGEDYIRYMQKVPRINLLMGSVRLLRRRRV